MRRCLIFDPGLASLGGGERVAFALGQVIAESHDVTYATSGPLPEREALARFGFPNMEISQIHTRDLSIASLDYDLAVAFTGGQPPPFRAAHNLVIIHFPFHSLPTGWIKRQRAVYRLRRYHRIVYSEFARRWVVERWKVDADVLAPAVDIPRGGLPEKDNLIVSVGRFFTGGNCKRQDVLVEAFSELPERFRNSWHLVLVGGYQASPDNDAFLEQVRRAASGLNVSIELNTSSTRLAELYDRARFFWHAAGFGRAPDEPECAEHFGLSTVEAMSHGAIPLVFADGGQVEIVTPGAGGVLWESIPQLVDQTVALMACAATDLNARGTAAQAASRSFGIERFNEEARQIVTRCTSQRALPVGARRALAVAACGGRRVMSSINPLAQATHGQSTG